MDSERKVGMVVFVWCCLVLGRIAARPIEMDDCVCGEGREMGKTRRVFGGLCGGLDCHSCRCVAVFIVLSCVVCCVAFSVTVKAGRGWVYSFKSRVRVYLIFLTGAAAHL